MIWGSSSQRSWPSSPEEKAAELGSPRRLALIVEDDPGIRRIVSESLVRLGAQVVEAENGRGALALLQRLKPDVVCLDLLLPEVSGYSICEFIRSTEALQRVPVLVMSARSRPQDRADAEEVGASAFLSKPFTSSQFREMILGIWVANSANTFVPRPRDAP